MTLLVTLILLESTTQAGVKMQHFTHRSFDVYLVEKDDFDYVTFGISLGQGAVTDPRQKAGLTYVTGQMLLRGTDRWSQAEVARRIDQLGSTLNVHVGYHSIVVDGDAIKRNLDDFVAIVAEVLLRPTFPQSELDKLIRLSRAELQQMRDNDAQLAAYFFPRFAYGSHPYGTPIRGTLVTLSKIAREDVTGRYQALMAKSPLVVTVSGKITRPEVERLLDKHFAGLKAPQVETPAVAPPTKSAGRRILLIDKPGRTQTQFRIGHLSLQASHADGFPLLLAHTVFGGTFTARLSQEIREKRGWSYGAYSNWAALKHSGTFFWKIFPANKDTLAAIRLSIQMFERLAADGITQQELDFAKQYLVQSFSFKVDTPQKLLSQTLRVRFLGLPEDYLQTYVQRVTAVTLQDVKRVLKTHMDPSGLNIVIVCTAKDFEAALRKLPGVTEVVVHPYEKPWEN